MSYEESSEADLAAEWRRVELRVPGELVTETLKRGAKMVPHLGALVADPDVWDTEVWTGPHAVMLLQAIGSPEAAPFVATYLRDGLGEDWLTEEGHNLVFRTGGGEAIWKVAEDDDADGWGRAEAVLGLTLLALAKEELRRPTAERLRALAGRLEDGEASQLLTQVCYSLADLHDPDSHDAILAAVRAGKCEWDEDGVASAYETPFAETLDHWTEDPMEHFTARNLRELEELEEEADKPEPFRSEEAKPGRNDPCPCGSGKKYKKCCGK